MRAALEEGRDAFFDALMTHSQRLACCDGCGMCEMHCPEGIPLAAINRTLSRRVQTELDYTPGRDVNEQLPRMT
jgi:Fe-S oxidoreductase